MIATSRRGFITGLVSLAVRAPAIVRAGSLMPVKAIVDEAAIARAMRAYIERIVNPPMMAAMSDMAAFGTGALEFTAGEVRHVPFHAIPIIRSNLPEGVRLLSGQRPWVVTQGEQAFHGLVPD